MKDAKPLKRQLKDNVTSDVTHTDDYLFDNYTIDTRLLLVNIHKKIFFNIINYQDNRSTLIIIYAMYILKDNQKKNCFTNMYGNIQGFVFINIY
jgi:hypothetical protein